MQQHLVLWGDIGTDRKALLAIYLDEENHKVHVYAFPREIANKELQDSLFLWKNGGAYEFPADAIHWELDANGESVLPEDVRVDKPEFITRAQEQWTKKLMSTRFYKVFHEEIDLLKQKVEVNKEYQQELWDATKVLWDKISTYRKNNDLTWEQTDSLKNNINTIFDTLKAIKRIDVEKTSEHTQKLFKSLTKKIDEQQARLIYNDEWGGIFDKLKNIQSEIKDASLRWEEKRKLFDKINDVFDTLRKYRKSEFVNRTKERITQLTKTIEGLQQSIDRDKENQNLQIEKLALYTKGKLSVDEMKKRFNIITDKVSEKEQKIKNIQKTIQQLQKELQKDEEKTQLNEAIKLKDNREVAVPTTEDKIVETTEIKDTPIETTPQVENIATEVSETLASEVVEQPGFDDRGAYVKEESSENPIADNREQSPENLSDNTDEDTGVSVSNTDEGHNN
jgi:chromosome segregation ATPase